MPPSTPKCVAWCGRAEAHLCTPHVLQHPAGCCCCCCRYCLPGASDAPRGLLTPSFTAAHLAGCCCSSRAAAHLASCCCILHAWLLHTAVPKQVRLAPRAPSERGAPHPHSDHRCEASRSSAPRSD